MIQNPDSRLQDGEKLLVVENGLVTILVGLCGNGVAVLNSATVFQSPPGSAIRPMAQPVLLLFIAGITAMLAWITAMPALRSRRGRPMICGFIGLILGISPIFVGLWTLSLFIRLGSYTLQP
jgi:hypothetical protein